MIEPVDRAVALAHPLLGPFVRALQIAHEVDVERRDPGPIDMPPFAGNTRMAPVAGGDIESAVVALADAIAAAVRTRAVFIPLGPTPWLWQRNDHPPAARALAELATLVDDSFAGAIACDAEGVRRFVPILFWLTRCCASLPDIYFILDDEPAVFVLCKYSIVHAENYGRPRLLPGLVEVDDCNHRWSDTSAIAGRAIVID